LFLLKIWVNYTIHRKCAHLWHYLLHQRILCCRVTSGLRWLERPATHPFPTCKRLFCHFLRLPKQCLWSPVHAFSSHFWWVLFMHTNKLTSWAFHTQM